MHNLSFFVALTFVSLVLGLENPRIAIVGAGIGGSACAYFIRELFGKNATVSVFERDVVGGRLATIDVAGDYYEAGGAVIHPKNKYLNDFSQLLGLKRRTPYESSWGIYNGEKLIFQTSSWSLVTLAHMYWRYGRDIFNLNTYMSSVLEDFGRIYKAQDAGFAFTSVQSLLHHMSPKFPNMTQQTLASYMKSHGFSDLFLDELVQAQSLLNYGTTNDINAFAGSVSLADADPGLWGIHGGNNQVPAGLLDAAEVRVVSGEVGEVMLLNSGAFSLTYHQNPPKDPITEEYDVVIIAAPLMANSKNIKFQNFPEDVTKQETVFRRIVSTFVQGKLKPSAFQTDSVPDTVLTNNDSLVYNSIELSFPVSSSERKTQSRVYKLFSKAPLTEKQITFLFDDVQSVKFKDWFAYPHYSPPERIPPFVLYPRLYYLSPIEWAASAMEMSAISAKNIALLIFNYWTNKTGSIDPVSKSVKDEL